MVTSQGAPPRFSSLRSRQNHAGRSARCGGCSRRDSRKAQGGRKIWGRIGGSPAEQESAAALADQLRAYLPQVKMESFRFTPTARANGRSGWTAGRSRPPWPRLSRRAFPTAVSASAGAGRSESRGLERRARQMGLRATAAPPRPRRRISCARNCSTSARSRTAPRDCSFRWPRPKARAGNPSCRWTSPTR